MKQAKFQEAFLEFFKHSQVDFWDELNAPEELAKIANKIFKDLIWPITKTFIKVGTREEYDAAYRELLNK